MRSVVVSVVALFAAAITLAGCNGTLKVREPKQELSVNPVKLENDLVDVEIKYTVSNPDKNPVAFRFPSGKQWDAWVMADGKEVFRESNGKMYTQAFTSLTLKSGESRVFTTVWHMSLDSGAYEEGTKYEIYAGLATKDLAPLKVSAVPVP